MTSGFKRFCIATASFAFVAMMSVNLCWAQTLAKVDVKIAVLAFRGKAEAMQQWQPTADYLSDHVSGRVFSIVPLTLTEMQRAVETEAVDFILTNPGNYVAHEAAHGVARIATIRPNTHQKTDSLGATIFTRNVDNGIETLRDLKGKRFMAIRENAFGGFQMAWREMQAEGINPFKDLADLIFVGFPQDKVVDGVLAGDADAGTVRAGVLENLAENGKVKLSSLRILNPQDIHGFPFALSTRLYPEWPFAKLKNTPEMLSQQVVIALLGMPIDHPAAVAGNYAGWTVPLDYQPVHELFKELHIGPYDLPVEIKLSDLIEQYWQWGVFAGVLMGIAILWVVRVEHLVAKRTAELSQANAELETQIFERKRAEDTARNRQNELAHVSRVNTMGELTASLAHEINQPLSAIANYATGSVRRLKLDTISPDDLYEVLSTIATEAERAAQVIRRVRAFVRKGELSLETLDVNAIAREAIEITNAEAERQHIGLSGDFTEPLAPVLVDKVQIEQVMLNLIGNAMDALGAVSKDPKTIVVATRPGDPGEVICEVRDNGAGLSETARDLLFEPFYSTKPNGMGMGLSISRSIVEASGGRLWVEVDESGATVFKFSLPSAPQRTNKAENHHAA
ncbi:sensor histidine kinase [Magnetovibrio sp.]|uniref:sensor histidine kinase n=1 Tax=Magnetovibrio sp. TaxID=2024836 RepID=UPI002F9357AA